MTTPTPAATRLDRFLPAFDFNEVHETRVAAGADTTWAALAALRPSDVPLVGVLLGLRRLPARLLGRRAPAHSSDSDSDVPILMGIGRAGFITLAEESGREVIVGIVGQFWSLCPVPVRLASPGDFLSFAEPGFARAVMNFEIVPQDAGTCRLVTETRIQATDPGARRRFGRYWFFVHPGSALIRRVWLRAVRRRAEAAALRREPGLLD